MKLAALVVAALLVASPRGAVDVSLADGGFPFLSSALRFADANACVAHLVSTIQERASQAEVAAAGPYVVEPGDIRAHRIMARDWGHEIEEFRCMGARLQARRWSHSLNDVKPITIEEIGRMGFPE